MKALSHGVEQLILALPLFVSSTEEITYIDDIFSTLTPKDDPIWRFTEDTNLLPLDTSPAVIVHWYAPYLNLHPTHSLPHAPTDLESQLPEYQENAPFDCS